MAPNRCDSGIRTRTVPKNGEELRSPVKKPLSLRSCLRFVAYSKPTLRLSSCWSAPTEDEAPLHVGPKALPIPPAHPTHAVHPVDTAFVPGEKYLIVGAA